MTTPGEITAPEKRLDPILASSSPGPASNQEDNCPCPPSQIVPSDLVLSLDPDPLDDDQKGQTPPPPQDGGTPPASDDAGPVVDDGMPPPAADDPIDLDFPRRHQDPPPWVNGSRATGTAHRVRKLFRPAVKTAIGIDIQPGTIHLVTARNDGKGPSLLSCESVSYPYRQDSPPPNLYEDEAFKTVLFRTLSGYLSNDDGTPEIWCSYAFCSPVVLHNVDTPKVSDKNLANAVFWSAKRELEFDEENTIFDFTALQELNDTDQHKVQALVTLIPRGETQGATEMFKNAGFPLTGLTFPAAAIQNFLHHDSSIPHDQPVVYFTIRRTRSFIDLFYRGKMFFSREIKTGIDSFIESFLDLAQAQNIVMDEASAREYLFCGKSNKHQLPGEGDDTILRQFDWAKLTVLDRFVRQLVRTFEYCATTFKIPAVGTIVTSGEFTLNSTILKSIEHRIGITCSILDPLSSTIFHQDHEFAANSVTSLMVAAGLALSDQERTANFLYTFADRAREVASRKLNSLIAVVTICSALVLGGYAALQYRSSLDKQNEIAGLEHQLAQHYLAEPRSRDMTYATQTAQKIHQFHTDNTNTIKRFKSVAILTELTNALGDDILLNDLDLVLEPSTAGIRGKSPTTQVGGVTIRGIVNTPAENQEFALMNFLKRLARLDLVGEPTLLSKDKTQVNHRDVLRFEIQLKPTLSFLEPAAT